MKIRTYLLALALGGILGVAFHAIEARAETLATFDANSNIIRILIEDTSKTSTSVDVGLTGLAFNTTNFALYHICDSEATATAYTVAAGNLEDITTIGTYAAPTASKARFKAVDATNYPGVYEVHLADARFSVANSRHCILSWRPSTSTVTNLRNGFKEYPLLADAATAFGASSTAELSAVPGTGSVTIADQLRFMYQWVRFKLDDNGVEQAMYKADGTTKLCEKEVADSAGTYTRGACGTPD